MVLPSAGAGRSAFLAGVSQRDLDVSVRVALDKPATGGGTYLSVLGRRTGSGTQYESQVQVVSTGAVRVGLRRVVSGTATGLTLVTVPGVTYSAGQQLVVRLQVSGVSPTTLRTKVWLAGTPEPAAWTSEATDSTAALQNPGGLGLVSYLSGSATNAPVTATYDDLTATTP
jgi:hypothetical protein